MKKNKKKIKKYQMNKQIWNQMGIFNMNQIQGKTLRDPSNDT